MNQRSLFSLVAMSASCVLLTVNVLAHTHQTAKKPNSDPPANLARTDYPDWPYPKGVHESPKPDDGQLFRIPGSTKSYTDTQINRSTSTVDWFPRLLCLTKTPSSGFPSNVTLLLPGRLRNPASSSLPHVADFNGIRHRWDLRDPQVVADLKGIRDG